MRIYGRGFVLTIALLAITLALTVVAWNGSANQGASPQEAKQQELTPEDDVPILDVKQAEQTNPEQLKGRKRGQSLRQHIRIEELPVEVEPLPANVHFWSNMPALPIEQSNAIVLGKIADRRAILMDDKLGIYSDFSIKVSEIFKDDLNGFSIDQVITAYRPGGGVRYHSGRTQKYTISSMGYPQQDKVYVLFLKRDEADDYSILTGYEITGKLVQPLDDRRDLPKNQPYNRFSVYRGASLESFRNALQKAIEEAGGGRP